MQNYLVLAVIVILAAYLLYAKISLERCVKGCFVKQPPTGNARRFREIFEQASDAIFVVEVLCEGKYRFESLNPAARQAFGPLEKGWERRTLNDVADSVSEHGREHILNALIEHLDLAVESGMPVRYHDAVPVAAEGSVKNYDFNLIPMADDGGMSHILCFARDITSYVLYEQELSKRLDLEERLSGFATSAPGFFYTWKHGRDGSNTMPFASEGIRDLFDLRPEDVEHSIAPINLMIQPDDAARYFEGIAKSAVELSQLIVEFRIRHPAKGELWIESRSKALPGQDGSILWHGFMHDVSERKKMEEDLRLSHERLKEAQRIAQMGSWELAPNCISPSRSDEIFRIFEIAPDQCSRLDETFMGVVHPDDRETVSKVFSELNSHFTPYCIDYRLLFADGRIKHVRERCETHHDPSGKILHSHGTVQDITSIKVVEQQLKDTQDKLRKLLISLELLREDERKRVAWEMHEELGQILAAIKMRIGGLRVRMRKEGLEQDDDSSALIELTDRAIKTVHAIVSDIRPTVLLHGIVASLEWLVVEFNRHPGMICELIVDNEEEDGLSDELATLVFRIVQESLEDAKRQHGVSAVTVSWKTGKGGRFLEISHDGNRFHAESTGSHSLRLFGMHERISAFGGGMQIFQQEGRGVRIAIHFPE